MKKCPHCGEQIQDSAKKCRYCGERTESKIPTNGKDTAIKFKRWQWIFYVLGWIGGAGNILFWVIMLMAYSLKDKGGPFFNEKFQKRVYIRGLVWSIALVAVFFVSVLITTISYMQ